jgi:hypothetical protein
MSACAAALDCGISPEALVIADASGAASSVLGRV